MAGRMKTILHMLFRLTFLILIIATGSPMTGRVAAAEDAFYLQVTIVTGEHSRDSNSTSRKITVAPGQLVYEETYRGAHSGQRSPVKKQFKLTEQDQSDLVALLRAKNLLVTRTISKPPTQKGFSRYFELAVLSALDGKENAVAIESYPSAEDVKTDPLYQGSVSLIELLYKIMNRTDPDLTPPTLIE